MKASLSWLRQEVEDICSFEDMDNLLWMFNEKEPFNMQKRYELRYHHFAQIQKMIEEEVHERVYSNLEQLNCLPRTIEDDSLISE